MIRFVSLYHFYAHVSGLSEYTLISLGHYGFMYISDEDR